MRAFPTQTKIEKQWKKACFCLAFLKTSIFARQIEEKETMEDVTKKRPEITEQDKEFMREAIRLAGESVENGGGPFGAVVVKAGEIIAGSANSVTLDNDPTAHAEVNAIRQACHKLGTFDLSGCAIYTSCEPCPMCLGAIYWAHLDRIYYGNTRTDAAEIDFDDDFIYKEILKPLDGRSLPLIPVLRNEAILTFRYWQEKEDKTEY